MSIMSNSMQYSMLKKRFFGISHGFVVEKKQTAQLPATAPIDLSGQLPAPDSSSWLPRCFDTDWPWHFRELLRRVTLQRGTGWQLSQLCQLMTQFWENMRKQLKTEDLRRLFGAASLQQTLTILVSGFQLASESLHLKCAEVSWLLWDQLWVFWGSFSSRHLCLQFCAERSNLSLEAVYWSLMHWDPWCLKSKDLELRSLQDELAVFLQALAHETWRNKHNKPAMLKQQLQQFWTHGLLS